LSLGAVELGDGEPKSPASAVSAAERRFDCEQESSCDAIRSEGARALKILKKLYCTTSLQAAADAKSIAAALWPLLPIVEPVSLSSAAATARTPFPPFPWIWQPSALRKKAPAASIYASVLHIGAIKTDALPMRYRRIHGR
jgi:hypothetical protein